MSADHYGQVRLPIHQHNGPPSLIAPRIRELQNQLSLAKSPEEDALSPRGSLV